MIQVIIIWILVFFLKYPSICNPPHLSGTRDPTEVEYKKDSTQ